MIIMPASRIWILPFILALGGLIGGILVFKWAPEAEGHGTDAAINSFHHKGGFIRRRVPIIKMIASAITIGSRGKRRQRRYRSFDWRRLWICYNRFF